jgi:hypothetical protein
MWPLKKKEEKRQKSGEIFLPQQSGIRESE